MDRARRVVRAGDPARPPRLTRGVARSAPRLPRSSPGSLLPAPGSLLPAPGSLLPAPGSLRPAPGSLLPAPGSLLPAWLLWACAVSVACGTPSAPGAGPRDRAASGRPSAHRGEAGEPPSRVLSYLQDDYERIFPERVRLSRYGVVRYAARDRGDAAGEGDRSDRIDMSDAPALVIVDRAGDRVRVIAPQDHFRLLLWVDVDDLYSVLTEPVALGADGSPARAGAPAPLHLLPGLPVEVDGERGGQAHVRHRDECVSFSGWIARPAIGTQFVPRRAQEVEASGAVAAGAAVYDRPGGREVARFLADCEVAEIGPEHAGHRPILYATDWFELRGWVASSAGKAAAAGASGGAWGYGTLGHLGLWGARARLRLSEGTCLYARRGGPAIGLVTEDADAPQAPPVDGWWQVPLETGWGDLSVWVAAARETPDAAHDHTQPSEPVSDAEDDESTSAEADRPPLRRCR